MNYSLEMIDTVPACNTLRAQAQRKRQMLELKRSNAGETIGRFRRQMDVIARDIALTQSSLAAFTAASATLPEGKDKMNMVIKVKRLEIQQVLLKKKAGSYDVKSLLAREMTYAALDSQVSVVAQYITDIDTRIATLSQPVSPALSVGPAPAVSHGVTVRQAPVVSSAWSVGPAPVVSAVVTVSQAPVVSPLAAEASAKTGKKKREKKARPERSARDLWLDAYLKEIEAYLKEVEKPKGPVIEMVDDGTHTFVPRWTGKRLRRKKLQNKYKKRHHRHQADDEEGDAFPLEVRVGGRDKLEDSEQRSGRAPREDTEQAGREQHAEIPGGEAAVVGMPIGYSQGQRAGGSAGDERGLGLEADQEHGGDATGHEKKAVKGEDDRKRHVDRNKRS